MKIDAQSISYILAVAIAFFLVLAIATGISYVVLPLIPYVKFANAGNQLVVCTVMNGIQMVICAVAIVRNTDKFRDEIMTPATYGLVCNMLILAYCHQAGLLFVPALPAIMMAAAVAYMPIIAFHTWFYLNDKFWDKVG